MTRYVFEMISRNNKGDKVITTKEVFREFDTSWKSEDEVLKVFEDDVRCYLVEGKGEEVELILKKEETIYDGTTYMCPIKRAFRPKTVEEIDELSYFIQAITVNGEWYNVNGGIRFEDVEENSDLEPSLNVYFIDDECAIFETFTYGELANRTDVGFFTCDVA